MQMRRAPRIRAVAQGISARLDRDKAIASIAVGDCLSGTGEIGIERRVVLVDRMVITTSGVALPELDERTRNWFAVLVEDAAGDDDPFAEWFALMLFGQVGRRQSGP